MSGDDATSAASEVFGIPPADWHKAASSQSWFVGDGKYASLSEIKTRWNGRHAARTGRFLDDDSWHSPLWGLWLKDDRMVCAANLEYLLTLKGRGAKKALAAAIGREPQSVSRWADWQGDGTKVRLPPGTVLPKVLAFFDLPASTRLDVEPLFLGRAGVRDSLLRKHGQHYLENLSGRFLEHAIEMLRVESDRQVASRLERE